MIKVIVEKISENDYSKSITGKAYKVFRVYNGNLYPPMVYNPGKNNTPTNVWLDAEEGEFIELDGVKRVIQKGGNKDKLLQKIASLDTLSPEDRKNAVKSIKNSTLAYRPGWHLGDEPRATQFNKSYSWEFLDDVDDQEVAATIPTYSTFRNKCVNGKSVNKIYYIEELEKFAKVIYKKDTFFPFNFVWAECDFIMDINYQEEAEEQGHKRYRKTKDGGYEEYRSNSYQNSLAGLKRVPVGGYYRYRTNPKPDTVPWVITGAIKVNRIIDDFEAQRLSSLEISPRQGGNLTFEELEKYLGIRQI